MMGNGVVFVAGGLHVEENDNHAVRESEQPGEGLLMQAIGTVAGKALADAGLTAVGVDANFNGRADAGRDWTAVIYLGARNGLSGFSVDSNAEGAALGAAISKSLEDLGITDQSAEEESHYMADALAEGVPFVVVRPGALGTKEDDQFGADELYLSRHTGEVGSAIAAAILAWLNADEAISPASESNDTVAPPPPTEPVSSAPVSDSGPDSGATVAPHNATIHEAIDLLREAKALLKGLVSEQ